MGGHAHGFAAPAEAYSEAEKAGIGVARVLLPDHIRPQLMKFRGPTLNTEFAPSTPSGSFASKSLAELLVAGNWADGVLLAGDLGRNSETAIVLEKFVNKHNGPITLTKDAVDYFTSSPQTILNRPDTCIVLSIAQLQKLAMGAGFTSAITFGMDLLKLVEALHAFTNQYAVSIITKHQGKIVIAIHGRVSTTEASQDIEDAWRVSTATHATVWWLQNASKPFEALTTSIVKPH